MRNLIYWLPVLLFAMVVLSCEKEGEKSELFVSEYGINKGTGYQATWDGDEITLSIESNTDWSIEILSGDAGFVITSPKNGSFNACDWVEVYPLNGLGNAKIHVLIKENSEIYSRDAILVIHTNDGRCTENVWILQDGQKLPGYKTFEVYPQGHRFFHGRYHDLGDSIYVISPHGAEISGPSWIEAKVDHEDWKPLSKDKSRYFAGIVGIALRTANKNTNEEDLEDYITLNDTWDENFVEIPVKQLGRYNVSCNKFAVTADGFACDWRYGCDVTEFYVKAFEGKPASDDLKWTKIQKWQKFDASDDMVLGWGGRKELTRYEIIAVGVDGSGNHSSNVSSSGLSTGSSKNQPRAIISNVNYSPPIWQWDISMNEYAEFYYCVIWKGTKADGVSDSYVKWLIENNIGKYTKQTQSHPASYNYEGQIHVATLAGDSMGNPSYVLDRYSTANQYNRASAVDESCFGMRLGDFEKSVLNVSIAK